MSDDRAIEVVAEWLGGDRGWATSIVEALASAGFQITDAGQVSGEAEVEVGPFCDWLAASADGQRPVDAWRYRVRGTARWQYTEDPTKVERLRKAVDDDGGRLVNERVATWEIEALAYRLHAEGRLIGWEPFSVPSERER